MDDLQRRQIKGALLRCAKENEHKVTPTFNVVVSSVCKSAVERITELENALKKIANIVQDNKCKYNVETRLDIIGDVCEEVLVEE